MAVQLGALTTLDTLTDDDLFLVRDAGVGVDKRMTAASLVQQLNRGVEVDGVAGTAINARQAVKVDIDGKIVQGSISLTPESEATFGGASDTGAMDVAHLTDTKIVVVYGGQSADSISAKVIVGDISPTKVITFGTPVAVPTNNNDDVPTVHALEKDRFVMMWHDGIGNFLDMAIGTVAGTIPTLGPVFTHVTTFTADHCRVIALDPIVSGSSTYWRWAYAFRNGSGDSIVGVGVSQANSTTVNSFTAASLDAVNTNPRHGVCYMGGNTLLVVRQDTTAGAIEVQSVLFGNELTGVSFSLQSAITLDSGPGTASRTGIVALNDYAAMVVWESSGGAIIGRMVFMTNDRQVAGSGDVAVTVGSPFQFSSEMSIDVVGRHYFISTEDASVLRVAWGYIDWNNRIVPVTTGATVLASPRFNSRIRGGGSDVLTIVSTSAASGLTQGRAQALLLGSPRKRQLRRTQSRRSSKVDSEASPGYSSDVATT
jgi:hypothetical protein